MGALTALVAEIQGAHVLISERSPSRVNLLRRLGLNVVHADETSLADAMASRWDTSKADRIIAAVGVEQAVEGLESSVSPGGTVLWFGGLPRDARLSVCPYDIHYREVSIIGSFGFSTKHFAAAVDLAGRHRAKLATMITHSVHISEVKRAFDLASSADGLKIAITFGEQDAL